MSEKEYHAGDLIFAKVKGYPHWPARINRVPNDVSIPKGKYPIFFYGTHETYFLRPKDIFPYEKFKDLYGQPKKLRGYNEGLFEIANVPFVKMLGHDNGIDDDIRKLKSEINVISDSESNSPSKPMRGHSRKTDTPEKACKRKRSHVDDEEEVARKKRKYVRRQAEGVESTPTRTTTEISNLSAEKSVKRSGRISMQRNQCSELPVVSGLTKNKGDNDRNTRRSPVTPSCDSVTPSTHRRRGRLPLKPASDDLKINTDSTEKCQNQQVFESDARNKRKVLERIDGAQCHRGRLPQEPPTEDHKESTPSQMDMCSGAEHLVTKNRHKEEEEKLLRRKLKVLEKKKHDIFLLKVEFKLLQLELEIMKALQIDRVNVDRCMKIMSVLEKLPLNAFFLRRNPHIILTIRKCRKFSGSEQVRRKADFIYNRFKGCFLSWKDSESNQLHGIDPSAFATDEFESGVEKSVISSSSTMLIHNKATALTSFETNLSPSASVTNNLSIVLSPLSDSVHQTSSQSDNEFIAAGTNTTVPSSMSLPNTTDVEPTDETADDDFVESSSPLRPVRNYSQSDRVAILPLLPVFSSSVELPSLAALSLRALGHKTTNACGHSTDLVHAPNVPLIDAVTDQHMFSDIEDDIDGRPKDALEEHQAEIAKLLLSESKVLCSSPKPDTLDD
jgi:hypothetical protein